MLASRSVRHKGSDSTNNVLPSGWLLKTLDGNDDGGTEDSGGSDENTERLEITYALELDSDTLRQSGTFGENKVTDDHIMSLLASSIRVWFANLASFDHAAH